MRNVLWIDAGNGAAGDMLLAALIDAGADLGAVRSALTALDVENIDLQVTNVLRHGLRALHVAVVAGPSAHHRHLADVLAIIDSAQASADAKAFAERVFRRLADAEGAVHGIDPGSVHFHEVGALDSIADVLGCAIALDSLGALNRSTDVTCSSVALGSGAVRAAHGWLPVPPPAVLELVRSASIPVADHPADFELCTPTGAALLAEIAGHWGPLPAGVVRGIGSGAGTADPATHANVVRVVLATAPERSSPQREENFHLVEATVDDLDPRLWPRVLDHIHEAGAKDAWMTAATMRKGRQGFVVSAIADADVLDSVVNAVFVHTTTLGLRVSDHRRRSLARDRIEVAIDGHTLSVKRGLLDGRVVTVQPEYREAVAVAEETSRPVAEVLDLARTMARDITASRSDR